MQGDLELLAGNPAATDYYWALPLPPRVNVPGDNINGSKHGHDNQAVKRFIGSLLSHSKWDTTGLLMRHWTTTGSPCEESLWGQTTAFYQAAVPVAAELPLDHFWSASRASRSLGFLLKLLPSVALRPLRLRISLPSISATQRTSLGSTPMSEVRARVRLAWSVQQSVRIERRSSWSPASPPVAQRLPG